MHIWSIDLVHVPVTVLLVCSKMIFWFELAMGMGWLGVSPGVVSIWSFIGHTSTTTHKEMKTTRMVLILVWRYVQGPVGGDETKKTYFVRKIDAGLYLRPLCDPVQGCRWSTFLPSGTK